jgi:hypothetical protein
MKSKYNGCETSSSLDPHLVFALLSRNYPALAEHSVCAEKSRALEISTAYKTGSRSSERDAARQSS